MAYEYLVLGIVFPIATGYIGKRKGSSFWLWFAVGVVLPVIGLVAVILYRFEKAEPERLCPNCGKAVKLYVQVCPGCGADLYLPDPEAVHHPSATE